MTKLLVAPMIADERRRAEWAAAELAWLAGDIAEVDRIEDQLRAADPAKFEAEVATWLASAEGGEA
jgi:hypothetical protein